MADKPREVGLATIAGEFAMLGLTSFGGGIPAHIRRVAVRKRGWLTEEQFIEALALAQVLPGPNVVNLAVYVGRRLRGVPGAVTAVVSVALPGLAALFAVFALYRSGASFAQVDLGLRGAGAAVVGLLIVNLVQVGRRAVLDARDAVLAALVAVGILVFRLPVPLVVVVIGATGVWLNRPRPGPAA